MIGFPPRIDAHAQLNSDARNNLLLGTYNEIMRAFVLSRPPSRYSIEEFVGWRRQEIRDEILPSLFNNYPFKGPGCGTRINDINVNQYYQQQENNQKIPPKSLIHQILFDSNSLSYDGNYLMEEELSDLDYLYRDEIGSGFLNLPNESTRIWGDCAVDSAHLDRPILETTAASMLVIMMRDVLDAVEKEK